MTDYFTAARALIDAERRRQIEVEGWTLEHDDRHGDGEMLHAAVIYLHWGTDQAPALRDDGAPLSWPWDATWWKPKDRKRDLERAGALMLAEQERLARVCWRERKGYQKVPGQPHPASVYTPRRGMPTGHVDQKLALCIRALAAVLEAGQ